MYHIGISLPRNFVTFCVALLVLPYIPGLKYNFLSYIYLTIPRYPRLTAADATQITQFGFQPNTLSSKRTTDVQRHCVYMFFRLVYTCFLKLTSYVAQFFCCKSVHTNAAPWRKGRITGWNLNQSIDTRIILSLASEMKIFKITLPIRK